MTCNYDTTAHLTLCYASHSDGALISKEQAIEGEFPGRIYDCAVRMVKVDLRAEMGLSVTVPSQSHFPLDDFLALASAWPSGLLESWFVEHVHRLVSLERAAVHQIGVCKCIGISEYEPSIPLP